MRIKIKIALGYFILFSFIGKSQQLSYFSQLNSGQYLINPGTTGARKVLEARLTYRMQWHGFSDAPKTQAAMVHGSFWKGKMGLGGYGYKDETGPTSRSVYGGSYAIHFKFPDMKMSFGLGAHMIKYRLDGNKVTIHNSQDKAIDRSVDDITKSSNLNAGFYLHNDRFHFGLSVLNLTQKNIEFYKDDSLKKGIVRHESHEFLSVGYNVSNNPDYIWENTLITTFVIGSPLTLDYSLKLHYKEKFFVGTGIRMRDALIFQFGATFDSFQFGYSYDYVTSPLKNGASSSHEITLAYRTNFSLGKNKYRYEEFLKQKYHL